VAQWLLRPGLKTSGGEAHDIVYDGRYVGMMTLVYRENERLTGAVQLEAEELDRRAKDDVLERVQRYVEDTAEALNASACDVVVTYAPYERVIVKPDDDDFDVDWTEDDGSLNDVDPNQRDELEMDAGGAGEGGARSGSPGYELIIVHEERGRVEYLIRDGDRNPVAEALLTIRGRDVTGTVEWMHDPADEEIDEAAKLIVDDFAGHDVDTFRLAMVYGDDLIETVELQKSGLPARDAQADFFSRRDDYSVVLVRDDGDALTYEIYQQTRGGLPIGTATVDISRRQLTGFIDFRDPAGAGDRELIAMLLMEELDKEKDYDSFNVAMKVKNRVIDEILFENEPVH
jgi:hypothetical protein